MLTLFGLIGAVRLVQQGASVSRPEAWPSTDEAGFGWNYSTGSWPQRLVGVLDHGRETGIMGVAVPQQDSTVADRALRNSRLVQHHRFQRIVVTAYTSAPSGSGAASDSASNTIALSRDLLRTFTPDAPFDFGNKVLIPGVGVFVVRDTMHPRWTNRADIWFSSRDQVRSWGSRTVFVVSVDRDDSDVSPPAHDGIRG